MFWRITAGNTDSVTKDFVVHELANSTLYTRCAWTRKFNAIYTNKSQKAVVVNMVHECEIYEGGSVLELVIPKLQRTFFQAV